MAGSDHARRAARAPQPNCGSCWGLIAALRESDPLTVAELARRLKRNNENVHTDVNQLIEWMAVERDERGLVGVPWSGIIVDMKLPQRQVA